MYILSEHRLDANKLDTPAARKEYADLQALGPETPDHMFFPALWPPGHVDDDDFLFRCHALVAVRLLTFIAMVYNHFLNRLHSDHSGYDLRP